MLEWCEDVYDYRFYRKPEASRKDPVCGSGEEILLVLRGGSYGSKARYSRSAARTGGSPSHGDYSVGFRAAYYPLP